jgi:hypothetical protein
MAATQSPPRRAGLIDCTSAAPQTCRSKGTMPSWRRMETRANSPSRCLASKRPTFAWRFGTERGSFVQCAGTGRQAL